MLYAHINKPRPEFVYRLLLLAAMFCRKQQSTCFRVKQTITSHYIKLLIYLTDLAIVTNTRVSDVV